VREIGPEACAACYGLTAVWLSESITVIHESAFRNCTALALLEGPAQPSTVDPSAFEGCQSLTSTYAKNWEGDLLNSMQLHRR